MKSLILTGAAALTLSGLTQAQVLASDDFSYTGALTANGWFAHSGAGNKQVMSDGSVATLEQSGGSGEDVSLIFTAQGAADVTYASFDFLVQSGNPVNPDASGLYFAHLKDAGFAFRARTGVLSPTGTGDFVLAINAENSDLGSGASWPTELSFDTTYTAVISWDAGTGESRLWLDPVDMLSASISHTGTFVGDLMEAFAFRQSNDYTGFIDVDNVVVGKTFDDVNGGGSTIVSYCTAGTSASGCTAILSATGTPSATAPTGFFVNAAGVEGQKDGLYFFGANGRQANPWGNGTSFQCVVPPVKRAGLLSGVGTVGACDGSFSQDLNARWTSNPAQNPGAGAVVQTQLWYRDPMNTSNQTTSLSDAIEYTVAP